MAFHWKKHSTIGPIVVFAAIIIAGIIGYDIGTAPVIKAPGSLNEVTSENVSLMLDFGDGTVTTSSFNVSEYEKPTVWSITQSLVEEEGIEISYKEYDRLGVLVEAIDTYQNFGVEKAWQYWVDNEYATVSASLYTLSGGEVVMWKYVKGQL